MDEKQLAKLIRKNSEKAGQRGKQRPARAYDSTLPPEQSDDDAERRKMFDEMKRREF
jgi:hypothetical protein